MMTTRFLPKFAVLLLAALLAGAVPAFSQQAASITDSEAGSPSEAPRTASLPSAHVFAFPVVSRSAEAQKLVEIALDQYENEMTQDAESTAHAAVKKDPQFALAYAVWSFAARRGVPNPEATRRAEVLAEHATPDERLLVKFMTAVQKDEMLPAITAMNDLVARFPRDRHALFLTADWLYSQQDYERAIRMLEQITQMDPKFAPAFNLLAYAKVESSEPEPAKALAYLKHYAELAPDQPNPEDSLGEVFRYTGNDTDALIHYAAALRLSPTYLSSQVGLGDTYALMGQFDKAREEFRKALPLATSDRDRYYVEYQQALVLFWEGKAAQGLQELAALGAKAHAARQPYGEFEIRQAEALLTPDLAEQLRKLRALEATFSAPVVGMNESDRHPSLAAIWRDEVRVLAQQNQLEAADSVAKKLEKLSIKTRDLVVENCYQTARGFVLFARKDFSGAADALSADPHSPLALQWLATARRRAGDTANAEAAALRLKYQRGPTAEWFLVTHEGSALAN